MAWERDSWMRFAACRGIDTPSIFFVTEARQYGDEPRAKSICSTCPAQKACRRFANQGTGEKGGWPGIYAGMTHAERRREEGGRVYPKKKSA